MFVHGHRSYDGNHNLQLGHELLDTYKILCKAKQKMHFGEYFVTVKWSISTFQKDAQEPP